LAKISDYASGREICDLWFVHYDKIGEAVYRKVKFAQIKRCKLLTFALLLIYGQSVSGFAAAFERAYCVNTRLLTSTVVGQTFIHICKQLEMYFIFQ
jgi:hypothetical protein